MTPNSRTAAAARRWTRVPLVLTLLVAAPAAAETALQFGIDLIEGDGWQAEGITVSATLPAGTAIQADVSVAVMRLPEPVGAVRGIRGRCEELRIATRTVRCLRARLIPGDRVAGLPAFEGSFEYARDSGRLAWDLTASPEAGGALRVQGYQLGPDWSVRLDAETLSAAALLPLLAPEPDPKQTDEQPQELSPDLYGSLDLSVEARSTPDGFVMEYRGETEALGGSNALGTSAADGVSLTFSGKARGSQSGIEFETRMDAPAGEVYQEPIYVLLDDHPLELAANGRWDGQVLSLDALSIEQTGVVSTSGEFSLKPRDETEAGVDQALPAAESEDDEEEATVPEPPWTITSGRLSFSSITLPGAYEVLMRPFLANTDLGNMDTSGIIRAELAIEENGIAGLEVIMEELFMDDRDGRLGLYGLAGSFTWQRGRTEAAETPATLGWQGGFVYGIPLDAASLEFAVEPGQWRLRQPTLIPFLGGGLAIDTLEIGDFTPGNARVAIDARLQPVSMLDLTRALDWPPLSGTLSGVIPSMSYRDGALTFGGTLAAQMFDGEIRVSNFRLREPFNPGSRLEADIDMDGLDLKRVTEALSFGLITGKLDGYVKGLKMIDWSPVAFDARIFTPPGDKSRHRISQRAVDNIANLGGGGGAAALSKGFLRFFEDFSYSRIGLGCALRYDTCEMSGIEPAGTGYYILRGSGLPQINVVGYSRKASWSTIVEQLKSIMESEGPVIE